MQHLKGNTNIKLKFFRINNIASNVSLVRFYTGFTSYEILLTFYEFLDPAVHSLKYWGDSNRKTSRRRKNPKLDSLNQFFFNTCKSPTKSACQGHSRPIWDFNRIGVEIFYYMGMFPLSPAKRD